MLHFSASDRFPSLPVGGSARISPFGGKSAGAAHSRPSFTRIDAAGRFQGYASVFGAMDMGRDVVMPGAFRESLLLRGVSGVKLLWQHDPGQPIGVWTRISEDCHGLFVEGVLDLAVPKAKQLHSLIQRGALDGLSIGYRTQSDKRDPATGLRRLEKIDLWEISLVTFPLLPQARLTQLPSLRN